MPELCCSNSRCSFCIPKRVLCCFTERPGRGWSNNKLLQQTHTVLLRIVPSCFCFCLPRHRRTCLIGCRSLAWTPELTFFAQDGLNHLEPSRRPSLMEEQVKSEPFLTLQCCICQLMNEMNRLRPGLLLAGRTYDGQCFDNNHVKLRLF